MSKERNPKLSQQVTKLISEELEKEIKRAKYYDDSIWYERPVKPSVFYSDYLNTPAYPVQAETIDAILVEEREGEIHWKKGMYNESYLLWGEGSGKDWTSSRLMCYALYWLLCLKRPHEYFGLRDPKAPIEMVNVSFDEDQALNVYFKELKKALGSTIDPKDGKNWFEKQGMKVRESSKQQIIEFPRYITCHSLNSREHKVEGKGTLMAVFDEMAVFRTEKAKELYDNVISNMRSRFPKEHKFIALSYKRDDYDYMMVRWDQTKNDSSVYRSHKATWEVNLRVRKEDLQKSYDEDPEGAERRFECRGTTSKSGYFKYKNRIRENINPNRGSPILEEVIPIRDLIGLQFVDSFKGNPNHEYEMHVDLAKGKDTEKEIADCAGCALGHREETDDEDKPKIVIDLMCQIKAPKGKEIEFEDIRQYLIYKLVGLGFNISEVTLDGYQSTDFMQMLRRKGIKSELFSVDKDNSAYDTLKSLIYNKRLDYYEYKPFIRECEELQLINGKVDHPEISRRRALEEGDDKGSKDVSDTVAAICKNLLTEEKKKANSRWVPLEGENNIKSADNTKDPNAKEYGENYKIDTNDAEDD